MPWIRRLGILACALLIIPAFGVSAPDLAEAQISSQPSVRIYTDGIARPEGRISKAVTEIARLLSDQNDIRALPVMGYGGVANVDDLLHSRGVEFAILNADVLAYLDLIKAYPDARRKIRYITKLFEQKAYLLARKDIVSLDQLASRIVTVIGPESSTEMTARVVLQLSGVAADIQRLNAAGNTASPGEPDAVFFLEDDIANVPASFFRSDAFHLIPIEMNDKLGSIYRPATIGVGELPGISSEGMATIAVETLLTTFDWTASHSRYADVTRFIDIFFAALPSLHEKFPDSIWSKTDLHASIAGWERYAFADKAKNAFPPMPVAASAQKNTGDAPFSAQTEAVTAAAISEAVPAGGMGQPPRLSVLSAPPLTDQTQPNGGLLAELAVTVMDRVNGGSTSLVWVKDKMSQIEDVLAKQATSLALPWETPNCDQPQDLGSEHAAICDGALISEPLFQVPIVFFTKTDSDFDFKTDESVSGRVLCLYAGRDVTDLNRDNRNWVADGKVTLKRPATLIDCLSMVERGEADALIGNEAESRFAIKRLGLSETFKMAERPLATRGLHLIIAKDHPEAGALLDRINQAIIELKKSDDYSAIIAKHLPAFMPNIIAKVE